MLKSAIEMRFNTAEPMVTGMGPGWAARDPAAVESRTNERPKALFTSDFTLRFGTK